MNSYGDHNTLKHKWQNWIHVPTKWVSLKAFELSSDQFCLTLTYTIKCLDNFWLGVSSTEFAPLRMKYLLWKGRGKDET